MGDDHRRRSEGLSEFSSFPFDFLLKFPVFERCCLPFPSGQTRTQSLKGSLSGCCCRCLRKKDGLRDLRPGEKIGGKRQAELAELLDLSAFLPLKAAQFL